MFLATARDPGPEDWMCCRAVSSRLVAPETAPPCGTVHLPLWHHLRNSKEPTSGVCPPFHQARSSLHRCSCGSSAADNGVVDERKNAVLQPSVCTSCSIMTLPLASARAHLDTQHAKAVSATGNVTRSTGDVRRLLSPGVITEGSLAPLAARGSAHRIVQKRWRSEAAMQVPCERRCLRQVGSAG